MPREKGANRADAANNDPAGLASVTSRTKGAAATALSDKETGKDQCFLDLTQGYAARKAGQLTIYARKFIVMDLVVATG